MYDDNYSRARAAREAIARDGTSMLEFSNRTGIPVTMLEAGMSAYWLAENTRFTEEEIIDMGRH